MDHSDSEKENNKPNPEQEDVNASTEEENSDSDNESDKREDNNFALETVQPQVDPSEFTQASIDVSLNPSTIQSLAKREPQKLIELADKAEERIYNFSLAKENNSFKVKILGLLSLVIVIIVGFAYAAVTGNEELPREIIHYLMGGGASLGIAVFFIKK